jgi:hypothetical protein
VGESPGSTPRVILSPNARILVTPKRGAGGVTVAMNAHEAARLTASVAVQFTTVDPTAKIELLGGVQVVVTG